MLRSFAFASLAFAMCAEAHADCLQEGRRPGSLGPRQTEERGFTISRTGATFNLMTDSQSDRVKWRILRPNGRKLDCSDTGPASAIACNPEGRPPGYYKIFVTNVMSRRVYYTIDCINPP